MISPYVRRLRLGQELKTLRTAAGITHEKLAAQVTPSRQQISRLELGQAAPDLNDIMQILEVLGVEGERWTEIMMIAREAAERGWWESGSRAMGERQALFADLEAGATTIREYQQVLISGLLQTEGFSRTRMEAYPWPPTAGVTLEGVLNGRTGRQRMLRRSGGPTYEAILDELAVRRESAPPQVLRDQLMQVANASLASERITIRVLPVDAKIDGYRLPTSSFSLYTYADPGDPVVVGVESVTTDLVLTDPAQAERYTGMYDALRSAALSVEDSREFLTQAAQALPST